MSQGITLDQLQTTTGRLASFVAEALNIVADAIADIEITDTHIELATNSSNGLMSAEDKAKLDSIELTNNFTSEDKTKLDGIASNAQVNVIETVKVNNTALSVTNKAVNIDLSGYLTTSGKAASATTADTAGNVTGTVAIANGGTGATTAAAALTNLGAAASNHTHSGYAASNHTHSEYAAVSHGNHVPATQTANNAKFLRNDNTWQTVTPANIGAATSDHTHSNYAASNHTHTGYAASSHTHGAGDITSGTLSVARGGTGLTASPSMLTNLATTTAANVFQASPRPGVTGTLPVANGGTGQSALANVTGVGSALKVQQTLGGTNVADLLYSQIADNDYFRIRVGGTASNAGFAELATADDGNEPIYVRQYTGVFSSLVRTATLLDASGNTSFPGIVTASSFVLATTAQTTEGAIWVSWS